MPTHKRGFTIVELIMVITIMLFLALLAIVTFSRSKANARLSRVTAELQSIADSATLYAQDNNNTYPPDAARNVPPGLEKYLAGGVWPVSAWPYGVFDWDNWNTVAGQPSPQIIQMTYRLCDINDPISACSDPVLFPHFVRNSSIFYCITGPCVPHQDTPTVPGYCVDCKPKAQNPPL